MKNIFTCTSDRYLVIAAVRLCERWNIAQKIAPKLKIINSTIKILATFYKRFRQRNSRHFIYLSKYRYSVSFGISWTLCTHSKKILLKFIALGNFLKSMTGNSDGIVSNFKKSYFNQLKKRRRQNNSYIS